jgi:hypothetical protein
MRPGIAGVLLAALTALSAVAIGCKGKEAGGSSTEAAAEGAKLAEAEDGLLARRDALLSRRVALRDKQADLDARRKAALADGGDTKALDEEAAALASSEGELVEEERGLNSKLDELLGQRRAMMQTIAGADGVAGREAAIAAREKAVAQREAKLGEREASLSTRESEAAARWKEACTIGGTTTIVQAAPERGGSYTKKDVEPLLAAAREDMQKRGILASDLPEAARGLEAEAGKAMASGDYSTARLAARQLHGTVKGIKIDRGFIAAKIGRLNAMAKGKKLGAEVEQLFRDATASYGDGKFADSNRKLNKIVAAL